MESVGELLLKAASFLEKAGVESPKVDAEWLLSAVLNCGRLDLFLQHDRPLLKEQIDEYREKILRRSRREPLQYILGNAHFCGLVLKVSPDVLIPRPETELLVEKLTNWAKDKPSNLRIIDLGTGSGAIALALAQNLPEARILAIDRSPEALAIAKANAESCGCRTRVAFRTGNWLKGIHREADLIVANPPYLSNLELAEASPEVKDFEPKIALVCEDSGMADPVTILESAFSRLSPGGQLAMELGLGQPTRLKPMAEQIGYTDIREERDLNGRLRFLFATKS